MSQESKSNKLEDHPLMDESKPFRRLLTNWFSENAKDYPWRSTSNPYEILVSEIMLQQTQVVTVLDRGFYRRWLEVFPDFKQLADAEESEVLRMWEGLGYYSRARNLHRLAKIVVYELENNFPKDVEQIEALPGIGKYTAGAIASFAFDSPAPAVDANIARVLARLFDFQERIDTSVGQKQIWEWAADLVPSSGGRIWNSALMELGQTLCGPRKTFCNECPIAESCRCVEPLGLPIKKLKQGVTNIDEHVILNIRNGKVLLEQETGNRRKGMWKLPSRDKREVTKLDLITTQNYGITRYKVKMHIYKSKNAQLNENEKWVSLDDLASLPVPSPYRRALELITKV
tara:strand:- start:3099 stop:4130 length:1032 start_codon:yes stop_codon:yes gene_type:complete